MPAFERARRELVEATLAYENSRRALEELEPLPGAFTGGKDVQGKALLNKDTWPELMRRMERFDRSWRRYHDAWKAIYAFLPQ